MRIVWLDDPSCADRALVGGKAANLSRLAPNCPVPAGFCLTTAVFGCPRAALQNEVAAAYDALGQRCGTAAPRVAVRSSAVDEDGEESSFGGQRDTYLNLVGCEAIVQAIVRCWESARSPRALAYRRQRGLAVDDLRLAVLVQELIQADIALVAFSADPTRQIATDQVVVEASWGLGP